MAEKKQLSVFSKTGAQSAAARQDFDLDRGNIKSTGIGLREGEIAALDQIGAELGDLLGTEPVARNAVMRLAVRAFLETIRDGEMTPADLAGQFERPEKPKPRLKL